MNIEFHDEKLTKVYNKTLYRYIRTFSIAVPWAIITLSSIIDCRIVVTL